MLDGWIKIQDLFVGEMAVLGLSRILFLQPLFGRGRNRTIPTAKRSSWDYQRVKEDVLVFCCFKVKAVKAHGVRHCSCRESRQLTAHFQGVCNDYDGHIIGEEEVQKPI